MSRPSFNLKAIQQRRDKLVDQVFTLYYNCELDWEGLRELSHRLCRCMPSVNVDVVFKSLRHLAGVLILPSDASQLAWRLAGNLPRLQAGRPVTPWAGQLEDEWVPVRVLAHAVDRNRRREIVASYTMRILAGTCCTKIMTVSWSNGLCHLVSRMCGFSNIRGNYPFAHKADMVGLRMLCHVAGTNNASELKTTRTDSVYCSASMAKWNKNHVLKLRYRHTPCPKGWHHDCHQCAIGYMRCPAATHRDDYIAGICTQCGTHDAVFDPERSKIHCLECDNKMKLQSKEGVV